VQTNLIKIPMINKDKLENNTINRFGRRRGCSIEFQILPNGIMIQPKVKSIKTKEECPVRK